MPPSRYAGNKTELARRIKVSRPTLYDLFKRRDHPKNHGEGKNKYDVAKWAEFAAIHGSAHNRGGANGQYPASDREKSIIRKNDAAAARVEFNLLRDQREFWPRKEVNAHIDTANATVVRELRKAFEQELPPRQDGMTAAEIKKMNKKRLDDIFRALPKRLKNDKGEE